MASRLGKSVSQSLGGVGLAGGSMLLRLRRTSIALLAVVGAVGLGLVVFISQLGWPAVLNAPLPGAPAKVGTVGQGVALGQEAFPAVAPRVPAEPRRGGAQSGARQGGEKDSAGPSPNESRLGGSEGVTATTGGEPGTGQPASQAPVQPAGEPAPIASVPASPGSGTATAGAGGSPAGKVKAASDANSANLASSKSPGPKTAGTNGSSPVSSKASEAASNKAQQDQSAVAASPAPAASPAAPPSSPAAAKEAADAAK